MYVHLCGEDTFQYIQQIILQFQTEGYRKITKLRFPGSQAFTCIIVRKYTVHRLVLYVSKLITCLNDAPTQNLYDSAHRPGLGNR